MIGYKLFEMNKDGKLFPLFIDKNTEVKIGEWIKAKYSPSKGYATRGGWHIGLTVDAPWLKSYDGTDKGCYKSQRWKTGKRVWCEVEFNGNNCYDGYVQTLPKKCISDGCPEDGYYTFREFGKGVWIISSDIKVNRILSEEERQKILKEQGYDEIGEFAKYKKNF